MKIWKNPGAFLWLTVSISATMTVNETFYYIAYLLTIESGHTGHGPKQSYRGPSMRSCRVTMCTTMRNTAASPKNEPRQVVSSALRPGRAVCVRGRCVLEVCMTGQ